MENLDLFTPIEEGLPQEDGFYFVLYFNGENYFKSISQFYGTRYKNPTFSHVTPTHWLDLSKLTTKENRIFERL